MEGKDEDPRPYIWRPHVRRQILRIALASLVVTAIALTLLWTLVGPPSYDATNRQFDHNCWRCLMGIGMAPGGEGWAVGDHEFILHYTGSFWTWGTAPENQFLVGATMSAPGEGWAFGDSILHYRDGRWTKELDLRGQTVLLEGVAAPSASETWAVGGSWYNDRGFIWHGQQGTWSQVYSAPNVDILSVSAPAAGDAWAAGIRYRSESGSVPISGGEPIGGVLWHYHNGIWEQSLTTPATLRAVAMLSPTDGWATGNDPSGAGVFFHYANGAWTQAASFSGVTLYDLSMLSSDEGWASGNDNLLFRYAHGVWSQVTLPALDRVAYIHGIAATAPGEAWALGIAPHGWRQQGILLHYRDGAWTIVQIPKAPPGDSWQAAGPYIVIGFTLFLLIALLGALVQSLNAPRGSEWRHWILRVGLLGGICFASGYLITAALPLFADDLPTDPSIIANVAGFGLTIPGMVLGGFAQIAAPFVRAHRDSRLKRG